jgi:hypothetical protein
METLKNFLWPIVAIGGIGAFIDFLIGKAGQEKARDFLLKWWVRFDDVRWGNFGKEEGLFAAQLIERWFGQKLFSKSRILSFFIFFTINSVVSFFWIKVLSTIFVPLLSEYPIENHITLFCYYCHESVLYFILSLTVSFLVFLYRCFLLSLSR